MREVDFLPTWYREKRRRQLRIRNQCILLAVVFLIMVVWNSLATRSISQATARLSATETHRLHVEHTSQQFHDYLEHMKSLKKQLMFSDQLDSHLNISCLLAELSHLIGERIILSYIHCFAEPVGSATVLSADPSIAENAMSSQETLLPIGYSRFRIVLNGIAPHVSDVAMLIHELEQSSYFRHVILIYSRDSQTSPALDQVSHTQQVTDLYENPGNKEFEIRCYLANYIEPPGSSSS